MQSKFDNSDSESVGPFYYCSLAMMESGLMVDSFFEGDTEGVKNSLINATRFIILSSSSAEVELEGVVEEVESYENIDTETIIFMLVSDLSKLGKFIYDSNMDVEKSLLMNCMRDVAALEMSFDFDLEEELLNQVNQK